MFSAIARIFRTPDLRRKIGFTLAIVAIYRLGSNVPAPFVNFPNVEQCLAANAGTDDLLGLVNLFSGGALLQLSIFALGVMPYITATIITQLLRVVIPHFEALHKEGQAGQARLTSTRVTSPSPSRCSSRRLSSRWRAAGSCSGRPTWPPASNCSRTTCGGRSCSSSWR